MPLAGLHLHISRNAVFGIRATNSYCFIVNLAREIFNSNLVSPISRREWSFLYLWSCAETHFPYQSGHLSSSRASNTSLNFLFERESCEIRGHQLFGTNNLIGTSRPSLFVPGSDTRLSTWRPCSTVITSLEDPLRMNRYKHAGIRTMRCPIPPP